MTPGTAPTLLSRRGTWRTYTAADGLAGMQVEHIAEDADGYLWFATFEHGVSRFDGDEFRTFMTADGLCGNRVQSVLLDREGRLWFGTEDGGVCWYDGRSFHRFDRDDWVSKGHITYIFEDREGRIWFAGVGVRGFCDGTGFQDLWPLYERDVGPISEGLCWGIAQDESGNLWFGDNASGRLVRYDGRGFEAFGPEHGLPDFVLCVAQAPERGGVWVGGSEFGWYDGHTYQGIFKSKGGYAIRKIQHDRQGRAWFFVGGDGALCFDGVELQQFTMEDGLAHPTVNAMFEDREGHLWFATWGGGVSCYDPHSMQVLTEKDGLPHRGVFTLLEDCQGKIWMGFWKFGVTVRRFETACYDGTSVAVLGQEQGLDIESCCALYEDRQGYLWLGDAKGVVRYDGRTFQRMGAEQGFEGLQVNAFAEDAEGQLFLGYLRRGETEWYYQVASYDGHEFHEVFKEVTKGPTGTNLISAIIAAPNRGLWFGVGAWGPGQGGQGLGRFSPAEGVSFYTIADGLPDNLVEDMLEDRQGMMWIATLRGLSRFDGAQFQNFTIAHGLPHNHVQCLCEDQQGHLWVGTEGGVARYDGQVLQIIRSPHIASVNDIIQDPTGRFWFATLNGLIGYTSSHVPPRVRILQVIADRVYPEGEGIEIVAPTRQVIFEYKGMSFRTHPRDMLYTCRLKGHEQDWQSPTRQMRAFYQDLPPGEYTFQVKAIDRDLNYSEPAMVHLRVVPDPHLQALTEALSGVAGQFVGESQALGQVLAYIETVAPSDLTVLILGETGTGKGLAARAVHQLSRRKGGPFIPVNCGAIPRDLMESELFGHEKGAFTGAISRKVGKVELAQGGTLFLDEIGDLPLEMQVKLLHLLEGKTFERVGGTEVLAADVRVMAATNRDLEQMVKEGQFRQDLYFRLQVFPLRLPPLRERRGDIPMLAEHFTQRYAQHLNRPVPRISAAALEYLQSYGWPGNVRELEHLMQRAVLVCKEGIIRREDLAVPSPATRGEGAMVDGALEAMLQSGNRDPGKDLLERAEEVVLRLALAKTQGNKTKAAALLHTDRKKVERRARKYRLGE